MGWFKLRTLIIFPANQVNSERIFHISTGYNNFILPYGGSLQQYGTPMEGDIQKSMYDWFEDTGFIKKLLA